MLLNIVIDNRSYKIDGPDGSPIRELVDLIEQQFNIEVRFLYHEGDLLDLADSTSRFMTDDTLTCIRKKWFIPFKNFVKVGEFCSFYHQGKYYPRCKILLVDRINERLIVETDSDKLDINTDSVFDFGLVI